MLLMTGIFLVQYVVGSKEGLLDKVVFCLIFTRGVSSYFRASLWWLWAKTLGQLQTHSNC